jgi:VWFA-related protein
MLFGMLSVSAQQPAPAQGNAARLSFTVVDRENHFVATLGRADIRVLEDGKPLDITDFRQRAGMPLSILIMLDVSISQENIIPVAKLMSREFADSVIRPGKDSVGVMTFTGEVHVEQELTTDLEQVRRAIERVEFKPPPGYVKGKIVLGSIRGVPILGAPLPKPDPAAVIAGSTAIWDAVGFASGKINPQPPDDTRRVIILLTDGNDTSSKRKLSEAVKDAIKSNAAVYSIGIGDENYGGTEKGDLRQISERTGGRAFFPKMVKDLRAVFAEIEQELRSQYLVSYSPAGGKADGKMRKIKIELVNPELRKQGLQLSYQQGYFTR